MAGYDGAKTVSLYFGKSVAGVETPPVEIASSTTNFGTWSKDGDIYLGTGVTSANVPSGSPINMVMDELKISDNMSSAILADFLANWNVPGFPSLISRSFNNGFNNGLMEGAA